MTTLPRREAAARPASTVVSDGLIHRLRPSDLAPLPPVPTTTPEAVVETVARARVAAEVWRATPFEDRVRGLRRLARGMLERRAELLDLLEEEIGKNPVEGLFSEALGPLDALEAWARIVRRARRTDVRLNPLSFPWKKAWHELVPRGVVGILAAWNYPFGGLFRSIWPALLTGNGVVLKPSEYSPLSGAWFAEQLAHGLPEGLVGVVQGDGAVGRALVGAGIDACAFTGSPATGAQVQRQCAEAGIPCSAEMGGKDAAIVLADCDLERTVAGLTHWALHNAGQSCGALEIVYAERAVADALVARLAESWTRLRACAGEGGDSDVGPLANRRQLAVVEQHVQDALERGATLVCGGVRTGRGLFYRPTLLDHCTPEMRVVQEETFGPLLAIVRVDSAEEAVAHVNRGRYGLGASIWTAHTTRARRLAQQLDVGVVNVNNHSLTGAVPGLPWSGTRATGHGVANSAWALLTFARPRAVLEDRATDPEPFWMPFDRGLVRLGHLLAEAQAGRLSGAWRIPGLLRRRVRALRETYAAAQRLGIGERARGLTPVPTPGSGS